jgi:esterase/lipase superfamily enzyme
MPDVLVHFATNRIFDGAKAEFGMVPCDPPGRLLAGKITCRAVEDPAIEAIPGKPVVAKSENPDEGLVDTLGSWLQLAEQRQGIALLYTHGFNHSFAEAAARTAALAVWLEAGGAGPVVPLCFTWPSNGMGSKDAYLDDQKDAARSGFALARLIAAIGALRPKRLPAYLGHSMGARVTRFGMQAIREMFPALPKPVFGQAFIMAGDDVADVLDEPWRAQTPDASAGTLRPLAEVARHVTIGVNRDDGVVWLVSGEVVNRNLRLGTTGPLHPQDLPGNVKVVDYSTVIGSKEEKPVPPSEAEMNWIGHQYHRNDVRVRKDWVAALKEDVAPEKVSTRRAAVVDMSVGVREIAGRLYVKG